MAITINSLLRKLILRLERLKKRSKKIEVEDVQLDVLDENNDVSGVLEVETPPRM